MPNKCRVAASNLEVGYLYIPFVGTDIHMSAT